MGEQNSPAVGWYRDPGGQPCRRYWDGLGWTDHVVEAEVVTPKIAKPETSRAVVVFSAFALLLVAALAIQEIAKGNFTGLAAGAAVLLLLSPFAWGIRLAFRSDERRKQRQRDADRARALAINADIEHTTYIRGDDQLGVYGQFPPPPEISGDVKR